MWPKRGRACARLLLFLFLANLLLSGCWDRKELEERTSVLALTVDSMDEEKEKHTLIKVSVQIPIPIKIAGSGGGSSGEGGMKAVKVMSGTGLSMGEAMHNIQQRLNQELFYGHTRVIAVSEKVAKKQMVGIVDTLRRSPQMRRLLWLIVTPGEASSLLDIDPKLEQIPIVYLMDMIENGAEQGRIPDITLGRWFIDRSSTGAEATALTIVGSKNEMKWSGLELFHDDSLVGHIDVDEAWILLQMKDRQIGGNITIPCPVDKQGDRMEKFITVHPKKVHVKDKITPYGNNFKLHTEVLVEVDIIESMCELDYSKKETFDKVQDALRNELNRRAQKLITDCQQTYKVDVFGMGNKIRAKYLTAFESMNWFEEFPKAKIEVNYSVKIRRAGMKMQ